MVMQHQPLNIIMIALLTALTLSCPLSNVLAEGAQHNPTVPQNLPAALTVPTSSPQVPPMQDSLSSDPKEEEKSTTAQNEAVQLLCDFFGLPNLTSDKNRDEGDYCDLTGNESSVTHGGKQYHVEHLIATIADPKDSRLDYLFDRHLDAIQRAIEAPEDSTVEEPPSYVLDRYLLPWKRQQNPQTQGLTAPPQAPMILSFTSPDQVRTLPSRMQRNYIREPGVVLFRQIKGDGGKLLVLFLVGETPTRGIHKTAFRNALDQIQRLPTWLTAPHAPIRVLGPTFSGSADSLAIALRNWLDELNENDRELARVKIISGSATAIDKRKFLSFVSHDEKVTFYATVPYEPDAWCAFMNYLVQINAGAAQGVEDLDQSPTIAILSETNTIYGQVVRKGTSHTKDVSTSYNSCARPPFLSLTFPLHISQLRAEVAKTRPAHSEITNVMPIQPQDEVSLPMGEGGEPKPGDVVPLFSPLETASTELVLSKMLSAIQHEPIHYIGVFATDVQDRIFLTQALRRHVPNATLFTFNIDLLYLHSEAFLDFQGMLVITPYPLFSRNQLWSFPFHGRTDRMQFPTQGAQGWYNATLALLGKSEQMIEYGRPYDKHAQGASYSPVNWLSIVGRSDIWPVSILPPTRPEDTANTQNTGVSSLRPLPAANPRLAGTANTPELREAQRQAELTSSYVLPVWQSVDARPTDSSKYYWSLSIGILWFVGLVCLMPSLMLASNAKIWINYGWLAQLFSFDRRDSYEQRVYLFACCLSLLLISLMISVVSLLPALIWLLGQRVPWYCSLLLQIILWAMFVSIPLAIAIRLFWRMPQPSFGQWSHPSAVCSLAISLGMFALACTALYGVVMKTWPADGTPFPAEAFFFFLRTVEFRSGVSLLLPWFFIGLAAFLAFFSVVRRLALAERSYRVYLDFATPSFTPLSFTSLDKLEKQVRTLLICPIFAVPKAFLMSGLIGVLYIYCVVLHCIPSIEGVWFDRFFVVAFCLVPLLLAWMFLRFFWLALALRRLLKRLGWHPLFHTPIDDKDPAFHMLPKISLISSAPTYTTLSSSVTLAQGFWRLFDTATENESIAIRLNTAVAKATRKLRTALEEEAGGSWRKALKRRREAQKAVLEVSRAIARWMEPHWTALHDESSQYRTLIQQGRLCLLSQVAAFLQYILVQLQSLAGLVTAGLLLLLMAETSYPFQPHEPLLLFGWVIILIVVAVTILIFVQLSRDKVISLLSGTTPNKLNWTSDFIFRVLMHGVLPILILLGIQFPEVLQNLLSWCSSLTSKGP